MNQRSIEIPNKNDIPDDVKEKAEFESKTYGESYVFIGRLKNIIEKYGLEEYHRYLVDGRLPEEMDK